LEDNGGSGSANSHWEKRVFYDDVMAASAEDSPVFSRMTIAFLQDMGWYFPDPNTPVAEVSQWGRQQGCPFVQGGCNQWTQPGTTCNNRQADFCSFDGYSSAYCSISQFTTPLPPQYQWFTDTKQGGANQFADFCPLIVAYSNGDCRDTANIMPSYDRSRGASWGPSSRCIMSTVLSTGYVYNPSEAAGPFCYKTACTSAGIFQVYLGNTVVNCPVNGGQVSGIQGYNGYITCPPAASVC